MSDCNCQFCKSGFNVTHKSNSVYPVILKEDNNSEPTLKYLPYPLVDAILSTARGHKNPPSEIQIDKIGHKYQVTVLKRREENIERQA
jgi:hypothetical protein